MRTISIFILALVAVAAPAAANRCYWVGYQIYCDAGCHVTQRWFDGSREWMRFSCGPPPELVLAAAGAALIIIVGVVGIINSIRSSNSHQADIEQIERDIAADQAIEHDMQAAMRKADAHIASMLAKYRNGDHHG